MYFCIRNYIGTKGEVCRQLKIFLTPPVVYATDHSKAVVLALFLILCSFVFYTTGRLVFLKSSRALYPRFSVCFSILITSLGEEGAGLCASHTFVCLFSACMFLSFFSSSWC